MADRVADSDSAFWGDADDDLVDERYRRLVNAIDDGLFQLDAAGRFTALNEEIVEVTGYDRSTLLGTHVSFLLEDEDVTRLERELERQLDTGGAGETIDLEFETATRTRVCWELRLTALEDGGTLTGSVGVARRRTERSEHVTALESTYDSDETLTTILEQADVGIYVLDDEFDIAWADETIEEYFGVEREALIGRDKRTVIDERISDVVADPDAFTATVRATYDDNSLTERFECHVTGDEGRRERWLEHRSRPIEAGRYAGGRIELYYDITDRKRSETALRESEERFQTIVDAVEEYAIFRLDRQGRVISWNEGARRIKGYESEEILGEHVSTFYTEADRAADVPAENLRRADETGSAEDEGWRVRNDGSRFWANVTITAIRGQDGTHRGYVKVTRDMTDRHKRERQLESELETIVDRITDAFYALDDDWTFTYVNDRARELIDFDDQGLLGENIWETFEWGADSKLREEYERSMETQEATSFELYYPDPLERWLEMHTYPSETGLSVYFRDITDRKKRDRELVESERRYRTLAEYFPNGVVTLFDRDLEYTLAAGQGFDTIPVDPDDLEGQHFRDAWSEETADVLEPAFEAALEGDEETIEFEYADREWQLRSAPITDDRGNVFAGMTMAQDVTEQKEREQYLEDAKSQLEAATEAGAVGTWEWQIQSDTFVTDRSFARTFGIDPEAARDGVPLEWLLSSIHESDRERVEAEIEEAVDSCGEYETEYRVWNADDNLRWVVARGHVECDEDGQAVTFPGALTDITDRKRTEIALEESRKQLQTLFDVLPVGVVVANADGGVLEVNNIAKEIWAGDVFDVDAIVPNERQSAVWADSGEPVAPEEWTMAQVLEGQAVTDPNVYEIDTLDGEQRIIMEHGMPVTDDQGNVNRAVVTVTEITERREYQRKLEETVDKLEASNERLEHFAYAASHDLQEPLRMVSSYLQLIENRYSEQLDEDGQEFLEFAVDGADRMREMIDGLLEYSRVETQGEPLEPTDLDDVVGDVLNDLQVRIRETNAEITTTSLPTVQGDSNQLRQLFQNLLGNALEYSGEEPPRVRVSTEREGSMWAISVADEGIGIDPADQDRIFEVFQRLHSREEYAGTGIGLALSQRIVERHGGDIRVESAPGEGSTFVISLPAADR